MKSRWLWIAVVVFLLNTAYVAAFGTPSLFYTGNAVLHLLLGLALTGTAVWAWLGVDVGPTASDRRPFIAILTASALAGLREEKLFRRFKADESSKAITARRRMVSPEDDNERQMIHDHESVGLGGAR